jgi:hypothetical protein
MMIRSLLSAGCLAILLLLPAPLSAEPLISEFVADNENGLRDDDGTVQDWIELHNPSPLPFSLEGWYLTDNAAEGTKWRFPAVTMEPGGFVIVFASGKDRRLPGQPLHTNFSLARSGEYLGLIRPDGVTMEQEFAPAFPRQDPDVSYGLIFSRTVLIPDGASASYLVPASAAALAPNWQTAPVNPTGWTTGKPLGLGFGFNVPGFRITVRAKNTATGGLDSQAAAELLLARPSGHPDIASELVTIHPTFNVLGNGGDGHYGNNNPLPPWAQDNYVVRAQGTITVPVTGIYTFGINSDDGGKITIDGSVVMNDPTLHGPADHLGTVTLTAGNHTIDAYFWEYGGGDEGELYARQGFATAWDSSFRLVGDTAAGGLPVFTAPIGTSSAGAVRTNIESSMRNINASCFVRVPFTAASTAGFSSASLLMRYNDGFKAWLNGSPVASANAPATTAWNSSATASRPTDLSLSPAAFNITSALPSMVSGSNLLAIHGMNTGPADSNFLIAPEIVAASLPQPLSSAFYNRPTPGGINDIPSSLGKVADTVFSPRRGVFPDATVTTFPFPVTITTSTPGATIRFTTDGSEPSPTSGTVYSAPITVSQTTVIRAIAFKPNWESTNVDTHTYLIPDDIIRQSPTGEAPGPGWPAKGSVINGQVFDYGMDPDIVGSTNPDIGGAARVKAALRAIPSVSLTAPLASFWDPATGIYVNPGGRGLAWERKASLEILNDPAGGTQVECGMRIRGGFSRSGDNPKHAFHLYFRGEYGDGRLNYPVFGRGAADSFNQIDLRTSQNYSWSFGGDPSNSFLREEFSRVTHLAMGRPESHVRYVHLYLNGQYWGLFEFDERTEADHCSQYLGGLKDNWDVVKCEQSEGYTTGVTDGYEDAWIQLARLANPLTAPGVYTRRPLTAADYFSMQGLAPDGRNLNGAPVLLDPDALIDYMLVTFWTGNLDGATSAFLGNETANNWFGARDRTGNRGFQFFVHDFEHSLFSVTEDRTGPYNRTFSDAASYVEKTENRYNPMFLHADLLDVAEYRNRWHNRVQKHLFNGGAFSSSATTARINHLAATIDSAIIAESARWGDAKATTPLNRNHWIAQRNLILSNYLPARSGSVISQLRSDGLFPGLNGISFIPPGGYSAATTPLNLSGPQGSPWYYTLDGSDPRLPSGAISPSARIFQPSGSVSETLVGDGSAGPGATWKYRDPSIDLGSSDIVQGHPSFSPANWKHPQFNDTDAAWKSGDAELGGGDGNERTVINIGVGNPRFPVVYFRKSFQVADPSKFDALELDALIDDSAIFFLNGREVARLNMPAGPAGYSYSGLNALNEAAFLPVTDPRLVPSALVPGTNVICVQVHQANSTSSDLSFDLRLRGRRTTFPEPVLLNPGEQIVAARAYDPASQSWSALSEVTYLVDAEPASRANIAITEIQYHPANPSPTETAAGFNDDAFFEFIELMNTGTKHIDLMGLRCSEGIDWEFTAANPNPQLLAPGQRMVVVAHEAAFRLRYGPTATIAGVFSGQLDNAGEILTLRDAAGSVIHSFAYDDTAPWPAEADGSGASLVLIRPESRPDHALPASWRAAAAPGNPGSTDAVRYSDWKLANAPNAADDSDTDGDGLPLFAEYAFGGSPSQPDADRLPTAATAEFPTENGPRPFQTITATLATGRDDARITPQSSLSLINWTDDLIEVSRSRTPDGSETITWRSPRPFPDAGREFLRIRLTPP